mmetsp:Transcript_19724/g.24329  ORF Transcript_19724/g.24329 Transcript_19724/m.24329 type:complete len:119 (+) Transcript_19724:1-357(+)
MMSGKENAAAKEVVISPTNAAMRDAIGTGTLTPTSQEDASLNAANDELSMIQESLNQIEAILNAESKRRLEANRLTEDYIMDYLEKLETSLNSRVIGQFQAMERRIQAVDTTLSKTEQ